jgi:predicted MPP superfamily phosphohydrolase
VAAVGVDAFGIEPRWLEVTEVPWPVPHLPLSAEGMRIAHVTDVHLQGIGRRATRVLHELQSSRCQLVILTGDLLDRPWFVEAVRDFIAAVRAAVPRVVAVCGNWEHQCWVPMENVAAMYGSAGAELLCNQSTVVEGLRFVGSDDDMSGFARHDECANQARDGENTFYLSHSPGFLSVLPPPFRYAGIFSGHTHGGQAQLFGYAPFLPAGSGPYRAGRYDTQWGPLYVSRGVGTSEVLGRFMCRPELPIYTLVRG